MRNFTITELEWHNVVDEVQAIEKENEKLKGAIEGMNKAFPLYGVSGSILTASQWLRKVQGISTYEHYEEHRMELRTSIQLMEWYGDYVKRKTAKYYR